MSQQPAVITLSVLCPTGHTVTAKVSPNDPVLSVLTSVCEKRQLDPARHFLRHHKSRLDNSHLVRFVPLPNHGKLELVQMSDDEVSAAVAASVGTKTTICIQLKDGARVQGEFDSDTSLLDILKAHEKQGKLSLKSDHSSAEEPAIVHVSKELVGVDVLSKTTIRSLGIPAGGRELLRLVFRNPHEEKTLASTFNPASSGVAATKQRPESPPRRAMRVDDGQSMLKKLSYQEKKEQPEGDVKEEEKAEESVAMEVDKKEEDVAVPTVPKNDTKVTDEKKVTADKAPKAEAEVEILHYLDESNRVVVFRLGASGPAPRATDDDSFFDLSIDEVKRLYAEQVKEAKKLNEGDELQTKGYREAQKEAQKLQTLNQYQKTIVRVQFPDRFVLQAAFKSWQSVDDVQALVSRFLADPNCKFGLFTTPPRVDLDPKATLLDSGCVPSVVVYFTSETKPTAGYLREDVMAKESNLTGAAKAARDVEVVRDKKTGEKEEEKHK